MFVLSDLVLRQTFLFLGCLVRPRAQENTSSCMFVLLDLMLRQTMFLFLVALSDRMLRQTTFFMHVCLVRSCAQTNPSLSWLPCQTSCLGKPLSHACLACQTSCLEKHPHFLFGHTIYWLTPHTLVETLHYMDTNNTTLGSNITFTILFTLELCNASSFLC